VDCWPLAVRNQWIYNGYCTEPVKTWYGRIDGLVYYKTSREKMAYNLPETGGRKTTLIILKWLL
jgi:hypothetical protein